MQVVEIEKLGKKYKALVPDNDPPELWQYGIIVGPPDLSSLDLPPSIEVRLHNELYVRGLITKNDIKLRLRDLGLAIQFALGLDVQTLAALYEPQQVAAPNGAGKG